MTDEVSDRTGRAVLYGNHKNIVGREKMICLSILSETITDQCMHLTATLLSQYDFIELSHPVQEWWCPFENFKNRFHDVFAKELIELSALVRVRLDIDGEFGSKAIVGTLTQDRKQRDLSFRQACNKIIHAETLDVDFTWSNKHPLDNGRNGYGESLTKRFKNPIIKTTGKYREMVWQADICSLKYIEVLREIFST